MPVDTLPGKTELSEGRDDDEQKLLRALDDLDEEGERAKKRWVDPTLIERDRELYRGNVKRAGTADADIYFDCNFVGAFIDRMVAQLTDNRPIVRVENRKKGLYSAAKGLEKVIGAIWTESNVQRNLFKMCHNAAITRSAGIYTGYDQEEDAPVMEMLTIDQVIFDPGTTEAGMVGTAEYCRIRRVLPLSEVRQRFPIRGALVKADASLTRDNKSRVKSTMKSIVEIMKGTAQNADAVPRAEIDEWFVRDRQTAPDGTMLFPSYRRIVRCKDYVLWDGPNPFWDGQIPVDWLDWMVDPEHLWGSSEPSRLRRIQLSFNQLLDSLVLNQILSNFIQVVGDLDAVSDETWRSLEKISSSIIIRKRNRNASLEVKPPPVFGSDKLAVARAIFTYAQLLTGVTDVTLGESPGSLQSGLAIEGLQEGANLMTRARASRLEDMIARIGGKLISRVLQFVTSDRVFHLIGPSPEAIAYAYNRTELFVDETGNPMQQDAIRSSLRHLRFVVTPGSSAPGARTSRARTMTDLLKIGAASRRDVLVAADFQDPDDMIARAEKDAKINPMFQQAAKEGQAG